jgi:uncharacterized protein YceK
LAIIFGKWVCNMCHRTFLNKAILIVGILLLGGCASINSMPDSYSQLTLKEIANDGQCSECDLRYMNLSGLDLPKANFSGGYLFNVDFTRTSLIDSNFESTMLLANKEAVMTVPDTLPPPAASHNTLHAGTYKGVSLSIVKLD